MHLELGLPVDGLEDREINENLTEQTQVDFMLLFVRCSGHSTIIHNSVHCLVTRRLITNTKSGERSFEHLIQQGAVAAANAYPALFDGIANSQWADQLSRLSRHHEPVPMLRNLRPPTPTLYFHPSEWTAGTLEPLVMIPARGQAT